MAFTTVADLIIPSRFNQYVVERTAEKSALYTSGIVSRDPRLQPNINNAGQIGNMPFFQDLTGSSQGINTTSGLVSDVITTELDIFSAHYRGNAWGEEDIASLVLGNDNPDPLNVIIDLIAEWWARDRQEMLVATLAGVFLASDSSMDASKTDISTGTQSAVVDANRFNAVTFADATQLLGDAKTKLTGILVHSAVESDLVKSNLIDFIPDSEGQLTIPTFKGLRVIVDDGAPQTAITGGFKYISYIFGRGAIIENVSNGAKEMGMLKTGTGTWMSEFSREAADGITRFFSRQKFLLHPSGVKWTSASQASTTATNAELSTGTNWSRVFERKNVAIIQFTHNVAS